MYVCCYVCVAKHSFVGNVNTDLSWHHHLVFSCMMSFHHFLKRKHANFRFVCDFKKQTIENRLC